MLRLYTQGSFWWCSKDHLDYQELNSGQPSEDKCLTCCNVAPALFYVLFYFINVNIWGYKGIEDLFLMGMQFVSSSSSRICYSILIYYFFTFHFQFLYVAAVLMVSNQFYGLFAWGSRHFWVFVSSPLLIYCCHVEEVRLGYSVLELAILVLHQHCCQNQGRCAPIQNIAGPDLISFFIFEPYMPNSTQDFFPGSTGDHSCCTQGILCGAGD